MGKLKEPSFKEMYLVDKQQYEKCTKRPSTSGSDVKNQVRSLVAVREKNKKKNIANKYKHIEVIQKLPKKTT